MLKTLEEPPSFAHLILLTSRPAEVLPTIASRCQPVRFDAPGVDGDRRAAGAPRRRAATARTRARGWGSATRRARWRSRSATGPALRAGAEAVARGALRGEIAGRPWMALLERARAAGAQRRRGGRGGARLRAAVRDHQGPRRACAARPASAASAPRAARRRRRSTAAWRSSGCGCATSRASLDGAPELVHHSDRLAALARTPRSAPARRALRAGQELVEETRASLQLNPNEELALDALGSRLARALRR